MFPVAWNRHVLSTRGMDTSRVIPCIEQPRAWIFHVIHTPEQVYNYAWWLLLFYACLSIGTNNSMYVLYFINFHEVLALVAITR